ncbi:MAG: ubiquinol-cytochrome c reductase iron-sulfur subunit [Chloroflexota bacterium]|nr:MAG: ubiquinol-cytochrome c reductase iron-sulfur subunit [Chloroflexota bacterium]
MAQPSEVGQQAEISRRRFLSGAVAVIASFIGGAITIPAIGHIISPALKPPESPQVSAGSVNDFQLRQPKRVDFFYYKTDGWIEERTSGSAWVVKLSETQFNVFDPRCTHLGCPYGWDAERGQFVCPCHNGIFNINGQVLAGPPPRPLDRLQYTVQKGELIIKQEVQRA